MYTSRLAEQTDIFLWSLWAQSRTKRKVTVRIYRLQENDDAAVCVSQ